MFTKILYYKLSYTPGGNGRVYFRLEGANENRMVNLDPIKFSALTAVLAQKQISYDPDTDIFISYDDDNSPSLI